MVKITEQITEEHTVAIICDRCQQRIDAFTPEFYAITSIDHSCGYSSVWEDGAQITADICESCLKELIGSFCHIRIDGAARGILADIKSQSECSEEASRDSALDAGDSKSPNNNGTSK